jgi:hypothetical protein
VRSPPPGFAHEEARRLEDDHVGPEHFLLALARGDSVSAEALRHCGVVAGADFDLQGLIDEVLADT